MSSISYELQRLAALDRESLVERWVATFGCPAPRHALAPLLRGALAWQLQLRASSEWRRAGSPTRLLRALRSAPSSPTFAPGSRLNREFQGQMHNVTVLERGFEYNGQRYRSLTAIAHRITSSHRAGPRFFGLRE